MKKIINKNEELTSKINKAIEALGINEETELDMIVMDEMLIIKAKNKNITKKKYDKLQDINNRLMDRYESVLKKLAKRNPGKKEKYDQEMGLFFSKTKK